MRLKDARIARKPLPFKIKISVIGLLFFSLPGLFLPMDMGKFSRVKLIESFNWALREKLVAEGIYPRRLPVTDCLGRRLWVTEGAVVSAGVDGQLGTDDDLLEYLPAEGYKPLFAIPVR